MQGDRADEIASGVHDRYVQSPVVLPGLGAGAAESSGTVGVKPHGVLRSDAATIHADAASKKVTTVSDH